MNELQLNKFTQIKHVLKMYTKKQNTQCINCTKVAENFPFEYRRMLPISNKKQSIMILIISASVHLDKI